MRKLIYLLSLAVGTLLILGAIGGMEREMMQITEALIRIAAGLILMLPAYIKARRLSA